MSTNSNNLQPNGPSRASGSAKAGNVLPEKYSGISPYLSRQELVFVKAAFAKKVSEFTQAEAEKIILECMNRAYTEMGTTPSGSRAEDRQNYLSAMTKLILTDLAFYFPKVTMAEVAQAIKNGIRHQYGEYFGFNVISIHGFVENYLESEQRKAAMERQYRHQQAVEEPEVPSAEKQLQMLEQGLQQCEETYRRTKRIIDFGNVNYQLLVDKGLIHLTNERTREIYEMAECEIKRELENQELSLSKRLYLIKNPSDHKLEVITRAKELSLKMYFESKKQSAVSKKQ